jgi:hypothetical protein
VSLGHRKWNFFGYGVEPLLDESEYDLAEEEWELIERVRDRGVLDADIEGSVLSTGDGKRWWGYYGGYSSSYAHKVTYEEWIAQQDAKPLPPKAQERADLIKHWKQLKKQKDCDEAFLRSEYQRGLAQSSMGLRGWAARPLHTAQELADEERRRKHEEEHEQRKQWAIATSAFEKQITDITNSIDCNGDDRMLMRAMLRYMNIGPGAGKQWDADKFVNCYCQSNRGSVLRVVRENVIRCYGLLVHR